MPYTISAAVEDMSSLRAVQIPRRTSERASMSQLGLYLQSSLELREIKLQRMDWV